MYLKRLCGKERLARASMSFKTKTRASGSSFVIRGRSVKLDAGVTICLLVCDAFDTILGRQTHFMIFCGTFRFQMYLKRLCGKERLARASMSFKTKTRASGSSFVIRGRSVKLDAVIVIAHKSLFGYALSRDL
ncbi:hypothetical protein AAC387_Pa03g1570 [Persea americana]